MSFGYSYRHLWNEDVKRSSIYADIFYANLLRLYFTSSSISLKFDIRPLITIVQFRSFVRSSQLLIVTTTFFDNVLEELYVFWAVGNNRTLAFHYMASIACVSHSCKILLWLDWFVLSSYCSFTLFLVCVVWFRLITLKVLRFVLHCAIRCFAKCLWNLFQGRINNNRFIKYYKAGDNYISDEL